MTLYCNYGNKLIFIFPKFIINQIWVYIISNNDLENVFLNWRTELFFWDSRFSFSSDLSIIICIVFFFVSSVSAIHLRKKSAKKYFKDWYCLWKIFRSSHLTYHMVWETSSTRVESSNFLISLEAKLVSYFALHW